MAAIAAEHIPALMAITIYTILPIAYWTTEWHASQAYRPSYSYRDHYTSNLGVPHSWIDPIIKTRTFSRRAYLMNSMFILNGLHFLLGQICLLAASSQQQQKSSPKLKSSRIAVASLYCIGIILVAAFPSSPIDVESGSSAMHVLGAGFAIGGGNVNSLLAGIAAPSRNLFYKTSCLALGSLGLLSLAVFLNRGGLEHADKGLWQRGAIYPTLIWELLTAGCLIAESSRQVDRRKQE